LKSLSVTVNKESTKNLPNIVESISRQEAGKKLQYLLIVPMKLYPPQFPLQLMASTRVEVEESCIE